MIRRTLNQLFPRRPTSVVDAVRLMWPVVDCACILLAWQLLTVLLDYRSGSSHVVLLLTAGLGVRVGALWFMGQYRSIFRYCGIHTLAGVAASVFAGSVVLLGAWAMGALPSLHFVIFEGIFTGLMCGGNRLAVRLLWEWRTARQGQKVLIYGAGSLGEMALRTLRRSTMFNPMGFIDDAAHLCGANIHGRRVLGTFADLEQVVAKVKPALLLIAVSNFPATRLREVFAACMQLGIRVKQVTGIDASLEGIADLSVDDLAIEDLLRRPTRNLDPSVLPEMLTGKIVLVTGAGGSIGSELCRQICARRPARLVLIDHSEAALYQVEMEARDLCPGLPVEPVLLNLSYQAPLEALFERVRPDVIFHAAAYKHVPMVEANPILGVRNNVGGFLNLLDAAVATGVGRLVLISTDKAVRPTNVMGATKRICELLLQAHPVGQTRLCAVRFGNVLGSSGSVVPRFLKQIADGGPVTVTDPRMTRYFMLIPEAVELVMHSGAMAEQGEIFILDMGEPVKIDDMARQLIHLTGHVPGKDIQISYTGLRPGEKLYEELLIDDSERKTAVDGITVAKAGPAHWPQVKGSVQDLLLACESHDVRRLVLAIKDMVPEWEPSTAFRTMLEDAQRGRQQGSESGRQSTLKR